MQETVFDGERRLGVALDSSSLSSFFGVLGSWSCEDEDSLDSSFNIISNSLLETFKFRDSGLGLGCEIRGVKYGDFEGDFEGDFFDLSFESLFSRVPLVGGSACEQDDTADVTWVLRGGMIRAFLVLGGDEPVGGGTGALSLSCSSNTSEFSRAIASSALIVDFANLPLESLFGGAFFPDAVEGLLDEDRVLGVVASDTSFGATLEPLLVNLGVNSIFSNSSPL
jgi:hypothetical protein